MLDIYYYPEYYDQLKALRSLVAADHAGYPRPCTARPPAVWQRRAARGTSASVMSQSPGAVAPCLQSRSPAGAGRVRAAGRGKCWTGLAGAAAGADRGYAARIGRRRRVSLFCISSSARKLRDRRTNAGIHGRVCAATARLAGGVGGPALFKGHTSARRPHPRLTHANTPGAALGPCGSADFLMRPVFRKVTCSLPLGNPRAKTWAAPLFPSQPARVGCRALPLLPAGPAPPPSFLSSPFLSLLFLLLLLFLSSLFRFTEKLPSVT